MEISCLHMVVLVFTGITTNLMGMFYFIPVGLIRVHVCHLK